jgi:hypothetical protein
VRSYSGVVRRVVDPLNATRLLRYSKCHRFAAQYFS